MRNPVALYNRDRIDPHPKKPKKRPHRRNARRDAEDDGSDTEGAKRAKLEKDEQQPASSAPMEAEKQEAIERKRRGWRAVQSSKKAAQADDRFAQAVEMFDDDKAGDHVPETATAEADADGDGWETVGAEGAEEGEAVDRADLEEGTDEDFDMDAEGIAQFAATGMAMAAEEVEEEEKKGSALRSAKEVYAAPTREELDELKATESLFKSNLFKMQLEEMLPQLHVRTLPKDDVPPSEQSQPFISECLHALRKVLVKMTATTEQQTSMASFSGVVPPIALARETADLLFMFAPPETVQVVGSFMLNAVTRPDLNVDVVVQIPDAVFGPKDHINFRYFHKRAFYLAHIAKYLKKLKRFSNLEFVFEQGDPLRPMLQIRPKDPTGEKKTKFVIRLRASASTSVFKLTRLAPDRNNVRRAKHTFLLPDGATVSETDVETATPRYNLSLLRDLFMRVHMSLLHTHFAGHQPALDAIRLIKTWLRQRQMGSSSAFTLNGFVAQMILLHLFQQRLVSKESSSYQLFRSWLHAVANSAWDVQGVAMKHRKDVLAAAGFEMPDSVPSLQDMHAAYDVVFVDPTGLVNLIGHMPRSSYYYLRHEAQLAISLLNDSKSDGFDALFFTPVRPEATFDQIVRVGATRSVASRYLAQLLDRGGNWQYFATSLFATLITKALGDRAKLVTPVVETAATWPVSNEAPIASKAVLAFGILLDEAAAVRRVDRGPPADDKQKAAQFRNFWGHKSELRRFEDGGIVEAVIWRVPEARSDQIVKQIILHTLLRHANIPAKDISLNTAPLRPALLPRGRDDDEARINSREVVVALNELSRELRNLDLALQIAGVQGISATFRYAEAFPPRVGGAQLEEEASWRPALEVLLQPESSGKWPDDIIAIQHVKTALYIQIARQVKERLDLEATPTRQWVDVVVKGVVFRLVLFVDRELVLLRQRQARLASAAQALRHAGTSSEDAEQDAEDARTLVLATEKSFAQTPILCGWLHTLFSRHPCAGEAARLAKRWIHCHKFGGHIEEEAIELLVASVFTEPKPYAVPGSPHVAFYRFLERVATHDWATAPLVVDFDGLMSQDDYTGVFQLMRTDRASLPAMFLATPKDLTHSLWTQQGPSKPILRRIVAVAKTSLKVLRKQLQRHHISATDESRSVEVDLSLDDPKTLFRTPLEEFDILIRLKTSANPRSYQQLDAQEEAKPVGKVFKNLEVGQDGKDTLVGWDPADIFLGELKARFSHCAVFFFDAFGSDTIGVALNPTKRESVPFNIDNSQHMSPRTSTPSDDKTLVTLDVAAVAEEIRVLGRGLVAAVLVQRQ